MSKTVAHVRNLTFLTLVLVSMVGCQHLARNPIAEVATMLPRSLAGSTRLPGARKISKAEKVRAQADLRFAMAQSLDSAGDYDGAERYYQAVVDKDDSHVVALHRLAVLYDQKGDVIASQPLYKRALKERPNDPDILCDQGYSFYLQRNWEAAESSLRKALELQPDLARAHGNLGLVLARTKRNPEAHDHFLRGGCAPAEAHCNIAFALSVEGDIAAAQQEYALALQADPDFEPAVKGIRIARAVQAKVIENQQEVQLASHAEAISEP